MMQALKKFKFCCCLMDPWWPWCIIDNCGAAAKLLNIKQELLQLQIQLRLLQHRLAARCNTCPSLDTPIHNSILSFSLHLHNSVKCNTVQCSAVQCSAVQCIAM